jgi:hypothetical protein
MRIESTRTLVLALPGREAWRLLAATDRLPALVPDLDAAFNREPGLVDLAIRIGRRRRWWTARVVQAEPGRRLELASATPNVSFNLRAQIEEQAEGSVIRTEMTLVPPKRWLKRRAAPLSTKPVLGRLIASSAFFVVAIAGLVLAPRLPLPEWGGAVLWAVLGAVFLGAAAMLTGAHRRQQWIGEPTEAGAEPAPQNRD